MNDPESILISDQQRESRSEYKPRSVEMLLQNDLELLFARPFLIDKPSAWFGHIPFAHWLIGAVRPKILVELGTHAGVSYSAFCSTVLTERTQTRCFAVDTWAGDQHAGLYSERIYDELKIFNDEHYGHFSTLLRCTFDQALEQFEDNSIDVLHIDGFHTYEAVCHDFNSWHTKLSDKAVVLFHDINEYRKDFGVWRLWAELKRQYPSFEFLHSHGLGVLAVGENMPSAILELCSLDSEKKIVGIRNRFMVIGSMWETQAKAIRESEAQQIKLREFQAQAVEKFTRREDEIRADAARQLAIKEVEIRADAARQLAIKEVEIRADAAKQLARREVEIRADAAKQLSRRDLEIREDTARQLSDKETEIRRLVEEKNKLESSIIELNKSIELGKAKILSTEIEKNSIVSSRSWRMTKPLRLIAKHIPKNVRINISRALKRARLIGLTANTDVSDQQETIYDTIDKSSFFDRKWYLSQYPDVAAAGIDPIRHYISSGATEFRNPSKTFNTKFYLGAYNDVSQLGINPLYHYICYGQYEARRALPLPCSRTTFDTSSSAKWIDELLLDSARTRVQQTKPLVSIILPTKDRVTVLPNALESIVAQTYQNWELLLIDDGSTDASLDMVAANYQDPRIKVLINDGAGVCAARNYGLRHATGELIAYLDSDNCWVPEYLELMLYELERSQADSAYAALKCIEGESEERKQQVFYRAEPFNYEKLKLNNYIDLNIFIHRKELVDKYGYFDENLKRMVDWDLILRYLKNTTTSFCYFIGANYDASPSPDRITNRESISYLNVVRNKHWIDWQEVTESLHTREKNLISIIICVYGQKALTTACLSSIFTHEAGEPFEIILVDNGSDVETARELGIWAARRANIKLIRNPDNFNFSLGNNIGFAASRGTKVVFLNNDTEVSPEWLRTLTKPLDNPDIKGTQPKLIYPDGTIQCTGIVFSDRSPIGYPIYQGQPGDFAPTQKPRNFSAVTAACIALRAEDFAKTYGFDPIYRNGQEDIDLCLRIGDGKAVFKYIPDSIVVHHEGKSYGRGASIEHNRRIFHARWNHLVRQTDSNFYKEDRFKVEVYLPDNPAWIDPGYAAWTPKLSGAWPNLTAGIERKLANRTIAIKIGCPNQSLKDRWGDYHFAVALASAFLRKGVYARIDFLNSWGTASRAGDINLVLRGLSRFTPNPATINLMWMISHPEKVSVQELASFDHIFIASTIWTDEISRSTPLSVEPLLQCTDPCRFYPQAYAKEFRTGALFVANSRKILRPIVREAITQNIAIDIFGEMWDGLAPKEWVRGENIFNVDLPRYYANAEVVLNDHWDSMRERGFVSNRIFDVLACGAPLVTDTIAGLPEEISSGCTFFDQNTSLADAINQARRDPREISVPAQQLAEFVRREHSFDARAGRILQFLDSYIVDGFESNQNSRDVVEIA